MTQLDRRSLLKLAGAGAVGSVVAPVSHAAADSSASIGPVLDDALIVGMDLPPGYEWDPVEMWRADEYGVIASLLYERPFLVDESGELLPWLVTDWTVLDTNTGTYGAAIEFSVREGVPFHDGTELTAQHIANTYQRYFDSNNELDVSSWFVDVTVEDAYTLVLYTEEADVAVLREANLPIVKAEGPNTPAPGAIHPYEADQPIGTGPYEFDDLSAGGTAVFERYDDHWFADAAWFDSVGRDRPAAFPDRPAIETIEVYAIEDDDERATAVIDEQADVARRFGVDALNDLESTVDELSTAVTSDPLLLFMPHDRTPWTAEVRTAVSQLIDREMVAHGVFDGFQVPARSHLSPAVSGPVTDDYSGFIEAGRDRYEHDVDGALEHLDDVDSPIEVDIRVRADIPEEVQTAEVIVAALNDTGYFDANVVAEEFAELFLDMYEDQLADDEFALFWVNDTTGAPDTIAWSSYHSSFIGGCCNFSPVDRDGIDAVLDAARLGETVMTDADARRARLGDVFELVADEMAATPVTWGQEVSAVGDDLVGFASHPDGDHWLRAGVWAPEAGRAATMGEASISFDESPVFLPSSLESFDITGTSTLEAGTAVELWVYGDEEPADHEAGPFVGEVEAGGDWSVTITPEAFEPFDDGDTVEVVVEGGVGVSEAVEGLVLRPDIIGAVNSSPGAVDIGEDAVFEIEVLNLGSATAFDVEIEVQLSDTTVDAVIDAVEPDAEVTEEFEIPTDDVDAGTHEWTVLVDGEVVDSRSIHVSGDAQTPTPTPATTPPADSDGIPGYGLVAGLSGLGGVAYVLKRRLNLEDEPEA